MFCTHPDRLQIALQGTMEYWDCPDCGAQWMKEHVERKPIDINELCKPSPMIIHKITNAFDSKSIIFVSKGQ